MVSLADYYFIYFYLLIFRVEKPQRDQVDYSKYNFVPARETLGVLKAQNKKSVRSESKLINKSMEHLVEKEGWPAGGLIELR